MFSTLTRAKLWIRALHRAAFPKQVLLLGLKENTNWLGSACWKGRVLCRGVCTVAACSGCAKSSWGSPMNIAVKNAVESSCLSTVLQKLPAGGGGPFVAVIKIYQEIRHFFVFSTPLFLQRISCLS